MDIEPYAFARDWIAFWNARDVEAVLAFYDDDVMFSSPNAARLIPELDVVVGKPALRRYWTTALAGNPDLHFTLLDVFVGVNTLSLLYKNQHNHQVVETVTFRNGRIVDGHATHRAVSPDPAT